MFFSFRILAYSLINICIREWIVVLFLILFIVNWNCLKTANMGTDISIFSSSICSVFQVTPKGWIYNDFSELQPVVIPEKPHLKQVVGSSSLDKDLVNKMMIRTTLSQLPFISSTAIIAYFLTTRVEAFQRELFLNIGWLDLRRFRNQTLLFLYS